MAGRDETRASERPGQWLVGAALRRLWRSLRVQVGAVPGRQWLAWGALLAAGFGVCSLLVMGATRLARAWLERGLQAWDERVLAAVVDYAPMEFADAIMYESPGNLITIAPLIVLACVIAVRLGHALAGISLLAGYLLQRPLVIFGWLWWDRVRPDTIAGGIAAPAWHSFPSGHTAMATFVYGFLAWLWARATASIAERVLASVLALGWVAMMSIGRLRLGTHWPSDMVAGFVIALAWLAVVIFAHRRLERAARRA